MLKRRTILYILIFSLPVFIFSCNKEPGRIGIGLQLDEDKLNVYVSDTTSVYAYSVRVDSVRTDETSLSMLGSYYDPVFGLSTSSIYTQVRLSTTSVSFGSNPVLDSIILALEYTGDYYGDITNKQNFKVYEISNSNSINVDSVYYSNQELKYEEEEIGSVYVKPSPTDSVMMDTLKYKAQLRIPLSHEFGEDILNVGDNLSSNDVFLKFLRGIYVTSEQILWGGAILNFDLVSANSKMTIYYSNDSVSSQSYPFTISADNARFMNFEHDYENAPDAAFKAQVIDGDTTLGDNILYIQAMAGVKVRFKFPYIKDWVKENNIAINEARLTFYDVYPNSTLAAPNELLVLKRNNDSTAGFIPDQLEGTTYYGGQYDAESGAYFFRISRYIQYLLSDDAEDYGLELVISGGSLMPYRAMLIGPNPDPGIDLSKRFKLNLIYTDLKD